MVKPLHVLWNCHQILEQLANAVYPYTDSKVTICKVTILIKNEFLE